MTPKRSILKQLDKSDFRQNNPKLSGANFAANKERLALTTQLASQLELSTAQLALAWLLHQGQDIFPIPGTRKTERIDHNLSSISVELAPEVMEQIDQITRPGSFVGQTLV